MGIRIIHTADNHIGMTFTGRDYTSEIRQELVNERLEALSRTVALANTCKAHLLVIAGDLFDKTTVSQSIIKKVCEILKNVEESYVVVLPGNHDFFEIGKENLWSTFRKEMADDQIIFLEKCEPVILEIENQNVVIYPGPCHSKTSKQNEIGWVKDIEKDPNFLHIGIAHGSVEGIAPDFKREYFLMTEEELRRSGVDFWLLGHIHIRYPELSQKQNPMFFYPATPTPDGFDRRHEGFVWFLEVDENKQFTRMESLRTGSFRFYELEKIIQSIDDIQQFKTELLALDNAKSLVKLKLSGRLNEEAMAELNKAVADIKSQMAYLEEENEIKLEITAENINKNFANGSLPHRLLSRLVSEGEDDNLALQLANELIENLKKTK